MAGGRSAELREERLGAEFARQRLDDLSAPAVERIGEAVARLGELAKASSLAPGHPDENEGPNIGEPASPLAILEARRKAPRERGRLARSRPRSSQARRLSTASFCAKAVARC